MWVLRGPHSCSHGCMPSSLLAELSAQPTVFCICKTVSTSSYDSSLLIDLHLTKYLEHSWRVNFHITVTRTTGRTTWKGKKNLIYLISLSYWFPPLTPLILSPGWSRTHGNGSAWRKRFTTDQKQSSRELLHQRRPYLLSIASICWPKHQQQLGTNGSTFEPAGSISESAIFLQILSCPLYFSDDYALIPNA